MTACPINASGTQFMFDTYKVNYVYPDKSTDNDENTSDVENLYPYIPNIGKFSKGAFFGLNQRYQVGSGKWLQGAPVTDLIDTYAGRIGRDGKPVGDWAIRVDKMHKGALSPHPHININPNLSGVPDPHTTISMNTLKTLKRTGNVFTFIGKVAKPVGIVTDSVMIISAVSQDGGTVGKQTVITSSEVAGGWIGGWGGAIVGAKLGAAGGAAIGSIVPGVGTVVGGFVGAVVVGVLGAFGVSWIAKEGSTLIYERFVEDE